MATGEGGVICEQVVK